MLNIAIFGPPGAGKGTQSKLILEKYNLVYISTGDILRAEISEGSELGMKAKDTIEKGGLASDDIIVQIMEKRMSMNNNARGFLFDGFPRTWVQAYILEGLLNKLHTRLSCMLSLEVPRDELVDRLLKRAETSNRKDDNLEVIEYRLKEYEDKTVPVIDYYKEKNIYYPIGGVGEIDEVFNKLTTAIEHSLKKVLLNIVIFGYPGAGKGTQASMLCEKYNLVYISTGKMLRREIKNGTEIGMKVKDAMEKGALVPDEIIIRLIERKISENPNANGFIFKGFPRTMAQAYILEGLLRKLHSTVSFVIDLNVSQLESVKRLSARSKTDKSRSYDRNINTIIDRLEEYEEKTVPVKDYYRRQSKVYSVEGVGPKEDIFKRLYETVEEAVKAVR